MPSSAAAKPSPALTVALVAGIALLLFLAFRSGQAPIAAEAASPPSELALEPAADAAAKPRPVHRSAGASTEPEAEAPDEDAPGRPRKAAKDSPATAGGAVATDPPIALAEDGTPLWKKPRGYFAGGAINEQPGAESEYQRQTRIWLEGTGIGRFHRETGVNASSPAQLEEIAVSRHPDDLTGQILFQLGYEWGYVTNNNL